MRKRATSDGWAESPPDGQVPVKSSSTRVERDVARAGRHPACHVLPGRPASVPEQLPGERRCALETCVLNVDLM